MDISNLDKAEVLAVLYNNAKPLGLGFLHYDPKPMTVEEAQVIIDKELHRGNNELYFDYLKGRVMKVYLNKDTLRTDLYNNDNGGSAAEDAINALLEAKKEESYVGV